MRKFLVVSLMVLGAYAPTAQAGKVEDVQKAVKDQCSKDVDSAAALRLVKSLMVDCSPDTKVDVEGCQVTCLKGSGGAVVGK